MASVSDEGARLNIGTLLVFSSFSLELHIHNCPWTTILSSKPLLSAKVQTGWLQMRFCVLAFQVGTCFSSRLQYLPGWQNLYWFSQTGVMWVPFHSSATLGWGARYGVEIPHPSMRTFAAEIVLQIFRCFMFCETCPFCISDFPTILKVASINPWL